MLSGMNAQTDRHTTDTLEAALKWIVGILETHRVPFQITGGFAAHIYGSGRPVNDIDIDVPDDKMELLLPDIAPYVTSGPARYVDERWDTKLITVVYHGQDLDICGADTMRIFDDATRRWFDMPSHLDTARPQEVFGIRVPVIDPAELVAYKRLLIGDHQKVDIAAVQRYLAKNRV